METYTDAMAPRFKKLLEEREAELREILRADSGANRPQDDTPAGEVLDFKDFASEQSHVVVDDAKLTRAIQELDQVIAARRRLDQHLFGDCLDCGKAIDVRRLAALPSTPLCSTCQAGHEKHAPPPVRV